MFAFVSNNTSFKLFGFLLKPEKTVRHCLCWLCAEYVLNYKEPNISPRRGNGYIYVDTSFRSKWLYGHDRARSKAECHAHSLIVVGTMDK